jgi:pimeloyl-ACP methyl ester carboxylesterase
MSRNQVRSCTALVLFAIAAAASAQSYDYPFTDPFMATVVGTPPALRYPIPDKIPLRVRRLPAEAGRSIPDVLWYGERLEYSYATQKGPAPLIFLLAGTGATHYSGKNAILMRAFWGAGFNVIGVTSPSHPSFVIAASTTKVPGHLRHDAEDIYRVMQQIWGEVGGEMQATTKHLAGYSLGATHGAFLAQLDDQRGEIGFEKVMLINPPLSLYNSISKLDRMLDNIPGGMDNFHRFFANVVKRIGEVYNQSTSVEFSPELVFEAFKDNPPTDEELASLVGVAFRLSSSAMIFTSDLMTDDGYVKPANMTMRNNSTMGPSMMVSVRLGFTDYFHEFAWPFYKDESKSKNRQEFAVEQSLHPLGEYLAQAKHIGLVHNQDDIILDPGEIDFFPAIFGERAKIYPHGGHMGNLEQRETLGYILDYFQR